MTENFSGDRAIVTFAKDFDNKLAELTRMWCETGMKKGAPQHNSNVVAAIGMKLLAAGIRVLGATAIDSAQIFGVVASIIAADEAPEGLRSKVVVDAFDKAVKEARDAKRAE